MSEAKTGLSALALKRPLGVNYPTAWLLHPKRMQAMSEREALSTLRGTDQVDEAYLGGERTEGKAGCGSENKSPFVAAVSLDHKNHPTFVKFSPVPGFTLTAIAAWAKDNLIPGGSILSDGLDCFRAVTKAGGLHQAFVAGGKKPKEIPAFHGVNTVLGNLKTSLAGTYHSFAFRKYGGRYLAEAAYRFNRRFRLDTLPQRAFGGGYWLSSSHRNMAQRAS